MNKSTVRPYLYKANRTAARIALYSSMVVAAVIAVALFQIMGIPGRRICAGPGLATGDRLREPRGWYSCSPATCGSTPLARPGDELAGARYLADILEAEGIETEVLPMADGRANLIATVEGKEQGSPHSPQPHRRRPRAQTPTHGPTLPLPARSSYRGSTAVAPST